MDEYFIGAGALLTAGPAASIAGATLHAQTQAGLAPKVEAALVDFEAARLEEVSRVLIVAASWTAKRFRAEVVRKLLARGECSLVDVIATLSEATKAPEIHLFAHWALHEAAGALLAERGIRIVAHPLEAIGRAALVCGQRIERWPSRVRAA
jgi:hypothetical protein